MFEPGRGRDQRRLGVNFLAQCISDAASILHERLHAPVNIAAGPSLLTRQAHLIDDFSRGAIGADSARSITGPDMALFGVFLAPPFEQRRIALFSRFDAPVKLRSQIIEPALRKPLSRVSKKLVVGIKSLDLFRKTRPPDSKGADAKFHKWFLRFNRFIESVDEPVHVVASPLLAR